MIYMFAALALLGLVKADDIKADDGQCSISEERQLKFIKCSFKPGAVASKCDKDIVKDCCPYIMNKVQESMRKEVEKTSKMVVKEVVNGAITAATAGSAMVKKGVQKMLLDALKAHIKKEVKKMVMKHGKKWAHESGTWQVACKKGKEILGPAWPKTLEKMCHEESHAQEMGRQAKVLDAHFEKTMFDVCKCSAAKDGCPDSALSCSGKIPIGKPSVWLLGSCIKTYQPPPYDTANYKCAVAAGANPFAMLSPLVSTVKRWVPGLPLADGQCDWSVHRVAGFPGWATDSTGWVNDACMGGYFSGCECACAKGFKFQGPDAEWDSNVPATEQHLDFNTSDVSAYPWPASAHCEPCAVHEKNLDMIDADGKLDMDKLGDLVANLYSVDVGLMNKVNAQSAFQVYMPGLGIALPILLALFAVSFRLRFRRSISHVGETALYRVAINEASLEE